MTLQLLANARANAHANARAVYIAVFSILCIPHAPALKLFNTTNLGQDDERPPRWDERPPRWDDHDLTAAGSSRVWQQHMLAPVRSTKQLNILQIRQDQAVSTHSMGTRRCSEPQESVQMECWGNARGSSQLAMPAAARHHT
jgi:hypothetical protein